MTQNNWLGNNASAILDAVVEAIITIDSEGTILSVNRATERMFEYATEELINQPVEILMPSPHRQAHTTYVTNYLQTRRRKIIGIGRELEGQTRNGRIFPIYLAISEIKTEDGMYFAGILRDLSEQKAAQAALLEERERLATAGRLTTMGEMTASIAHEINQPLTAMTLYAKTVKHLLAKAPVDAQKIGELLDKLADQGIRAGAVIERIQRFVRHDDAVRVNMNLNSLLQDLRQLITPDARLHNVELVFQLDETIPESMGDPIQIQQVALNLIRNAIDAMHEVDCRYGNKIWVTSKLLDEDAMEFSVRDCGPGVKIAADQVFTPFQTTKTNGMGMGLSICRSIAQDHGGELNFANLASFGTIFTCKLPINK